MPDIAVWARVKVMKQLRNTHIEKSPGRSATRDTTLSSAPFEVNVIFTDRDDTAAALKTAESLARDLGVYIRLQAAVVVPMELGLDESPVSIPFMEQRLRDMVRQSAVDQSLVAVRLFVCRDWIETLTRELRPQSLVVVGGREHWWPSAASRMARALRDGGHRVVFVRPPKQACVKARRQFQIRQTAVQFDRMDREGPNEVRSSPHLAPPTADVTVLLDSRESRGD
jgi:hypothetical protein